MSTVTPLLNIRYIRLAGLGCIHRYYGRYDQARSHLHQAWQLAKTQQDHWRECTYLGYLAMVELETDQPNAVFPYTTEMITVAAKMQGEGCEVAIAQALVALVNYQLGRPADDLLTAITALQQADAKRILAYVLARAAEIDLRQARPQLAVEQAEASLKNSQIMEHPSAITLSLAILIQALRDMGNHRRANSELRRLRQMVDFRDISFRARTAIGQMLQQPQAIESS